MGGHFLMLILGVDEVGRGPLAGPVVAAAVVLLRHEDLHIIDSKKLSEKQIVQTAQAIKFYSEYAIGIADIHEIERYNILQATMLAMRRAIIQIQTRYDAILVDGNQNPFHNIDMTSAEKCLQLISYSQNSNNEAKRYHVVEEQIDKHGVLDGVDININTQLVKQFTSMINSNNHIKVKTVIGGDRQCRAIAAASIIAKAYRDNLMKKYHEQFPVYHWNSNKGYGTKEHINAIQCHGLSPLHRISFCSKFSQATA